MSGGITARSIQYLARLQLLGGSVNANSLFVVGDAVQQGGLLNASDIALHLRSTFRLEGGQLRTDILTMAGTFEHKGGWLHAGLENVTGTFIQTGGANVVTDRLAIRTVGDYRGMYKLLGGALSAANITGQVSLLGGVLSVQTMGGTLVNDGGVIAPGQSIGTMSLGGLVQNSGTLQIELGALDDFDKVWIADSATLGGVLELRSMSNYRPREGDCFPIITVTSLHPSTPYFQGDFAAITSDITTGLGGGAAFSGGAEGQEYRVTFLGWTAGDANGDHIVDGGDLALIGRTRMQTGKGWSEGDFTGDGLVDGGDLALFGGNWMWALPAPTPPGASSSDVPLPEPAAGCLLGLGAMALVARRRGATARRMGDA
jgi:hypothetical protein